MTRILEQVIITPISSAGEYAWTWHDYSPKRARNTLFCEIERDGIGYHVYFDLNCTLEQVQSVIDWHYDVLWEVVHVLERDHGVQT